MIFEVSGGAVYVVSAGGNGGGALGHPVSSGPVSHFGGSQKSIFSGKFCKNMKSTTNGQTRNKSKAKEGQRRSKSHYQNFEIGNFRFSQTCS